MIRVNLLPPRFIRQARNRRYKIFGGAVGILIILALGANVLRQFTAIRDLESQIEEKKKEAAPFEAKIAEIQRLKTFEEELGKRRSVVGELVRTQGLYPRLLEKMARLMPKNAWMEQLLVDEPKDAAGAIKVTVRGAALGKTEILALQEALRIQREFEAVFLKSLTGLSVLKGVGYQGWNYEILFDYQPSKVNTGAAVGS